MYKPNLGVIEKDFGTEEVSLADINYVSLNSLARARDFRLGDCTDHSNCTYATSIWNRNTLSILYVQQTVTYRYIATFEQYSKGKNKGDVILQGAPRRKLPEASKRWCHQESLEYCIDFVSNPQHE
jgi:hypothetical protein